MDKEYLRKVGLSLASAAKRGDEPAVAKWATKALVSVMPEALADEDDDEVEFVPDPSLFEGDVSSDDQVYLFGGTENGNPNHASFTYGQAKAWWSYVFALGVNWRYVRSVPGGLVLSPKGHRLATQIGRDSTTFAPPDWNPLGQEIIP